MIVKGEGLWIDLFALLTVSVHAENSHLSDIKRNTIVMVMPMGFSRILQDSSKILKRGDGISENHQLIDFVHFNFNFISN